MKTLNKKEKTDIETSFTETTKGFLKLSDLVKSEPVPLANQVREGLREIKAIREGRVKSQSLDELLNEMRSGH